jgi:hypothetical protein
MGGQVVRLRIHIRLNSVSPMTQMVQLRVHVFGSLAGVPRVIYHTFAKLNLQELDIIVRCQRRRSNKCYVLQRPQEVGGESPVLRVAFKPRVLGHHAALFVKGEYVHMHMITLAVLHTEEFALWRLFPDKVLIDILA